MFRSRKLLYIILLTGSLFVLNIGQELLTVQLSAASSD